MIQIITDSAADFTSQELDALNIRCIPLSISFGDTHYRENEDLSKEQFYAMLQTSHQLPKTSQPAPGELTDLFEQAHEQGDSAIYITISSGLSGTFQTSQMVQSMLDYDDCYVVDSRSATGGQRILAEEAVRLRDAGCAADEIVKKICALRERLVFFACINTLENLHRGGRISQTAFTLGTLAKIKPILRVEPDGRVAIPAKTLGMRKGMDYLCERLKERERDPRHPLYVVYTSCRDVAMELVKKLERIGITVEEPHILQVGAAIGTHIGPDACGLVYASQG